LFLVTVSGRFRMQGPHQHEEGVQVAQLAAAEGAADAHAGALHHLVALHHLQAHAQASTHWNNTRTEAVHVRRFISVIPAGSEVAGAQAAFPYHEVPSSITCVPLTHMDGSGPVATRHGRIKTVRAFARSVDNTVVSSSAGDGQVDGGARGKHRTKVHAFVMGRTAVAAGIAARIAGERKTLAESDARFRPGADTACGSDGRTCLMVLVVGCRRSNSAQATAVGRQ
jgi:hypothetical protein